MKTILTYGTFDLFHFGHVNLLKRLRVLGDRLIVGCSSDEFNAKKGKKTVIPFEQRAIVLDACKYVDLVIPEHSWEQKPKDIKKYQIDIFAIGDDWAGHFDDLQDFCEVVYLPRTTGVSSTEIKHLLAKTVEDEITSILIELQNVENRLQALKEKSKT